MGETVDAIVALEVVVVNAVVGRIGGGIVVGSIGVIATIIPIVGAAVTVAKTSVDDEEKTEGVGLHRHLPPHPMIGDLITHPDMEESERRLSPEKSLARDLSSQKYALFKP